VRRHGSISDGRSGSAAGPQRARWVGRTRRPAAYPAQDIDPTRVGAARWFDDREAGPSSTSYLPAEAVRRAALAW
jgi:hypothetical protein